MKFTHEHLKALDGKFENWHYVLEDGDKYRLTEDELGWLDFVQGKYAIYDAIMDNIEVVGEDEDFILTIDTWELSKALCEDGTFPFASCLSEATALASILFYTAMELDEEMDND